MSEPIRMEVFSAGETGDSEEAAGAFSLAAGSLGAGADSDGAEEEGAAFPLEQPGRAPQRSAADSRTRSIFFMLHHPFNSILLLHCSEIGVKIH